MNRFRNFPASEFLSDFEVVELQNEMLRQRRRQEESKENQESESSESDSDSNESTFQDSSTLVSQEINLSDDDIASDLEEDQFLLDVNLEESGLLNSSDNNSIIQNGIDKSEILSGSNDSNDSYQSMYSTSSKTSPKHAESMIHITNIILQKNIIPIQFNDIQFLEDLNEANLELGPIVSAVRMSFQAKIILTNFLCAIFVVEFHPKEVIPIKKLIL